MVNVSKGQKVKDENTLEVTVTVSSVLGVHEVEHAAAGHKHREQTLKIQDFQGS